MPSRLVEETVKEPEKKETKGTFIRPPVFLLLLTSRNTGSHSLFYCHDWTLLWLHCSSAT